MFSSCCFSACSKTMQADGNPVSLLINTHTYDCNPQFIFSVVNICGAGAHLCPCGHVSGGGVSLVLAREEGHAPKLTSTLKLACAHIRPFLQRQRMSGEWTQTIGSSTQTRVSNGNTQKIIAWLCSKGFPCVLFHIFP